MQKVANPYMDDKIVIDELPRHGSPQDRGSADAYYGRHYDPHYYVGASITSERVEKDNIVDFVGHPQRIFPIGRLDKPSEGLILMTSDGDIVNKILRARNNHEKEYVVSVDRPIRQEFITKMRNGVPILDTVTRKCYVEQMGARSFRIILTQGLNRQIRRMCEHLGYRVTKLKRVRIMNINLDLPIGDWRDLKKHELKELRRLCETSSKTNQ